MSAPSSLDIPILVETPTDGLASGAMIGGKYRVERRLAVGGMSIVYACTDVLLGRSAAVKAIHPTIARDESIRARFYLEARTLARLNNPHITRVFECGYTHDGEPYIAMELLEGVDFYELLHSEGPVRPERAAHLALQVCRGLCDAHALSVVHRDLKPENLFLTRSRGGGELVKIIDFGISKQHSSRKGRSLTHPSMSIGSPHYMAPEQIRSPSDVDARADIWSLGVVLYELVSGCPPFDGATWDDVCRAVLSASPAPLAGSAPPALEAIVRRCLERDRNARFESADHLAQALRAFLGERRQSWSGYPSQSPLTAPVAVPLTVDHEPRKRASRPHRAALLAAAGVLLALAAGGLVYSAKMKLLSQLPAFVSPALIAERSAIKAVSLPPSQAAPASAAIDGGVPPEAPAQKPRVRAAHRRWVAPKPTSAAALAVDAPPVAEPRATDIDDAQ